MLVRSGLPSSFHTLSVDRVSPSLAPRISPIISAVDTNAIQSRYTAGQPEGSRVLYDLF